VAAGTMCDGRNWEVVGNVAVAGEEWAEEVGEDSFPVDQAKVAEAGEGNTGLEAKRAEERIAAELESNISNYGLKKL
jgi:hypothetical protein